jgi:hypothetical protein
LQELTGFLVARRLNWYSSGCFYISGVLAFETLQSLLISVRPDWQCAVSDVELRRYIMNGCDGIVERRDSAFYKSFAIRMPPDLILDASSVVAAFWYSVYK